MFLLDCLIRLPPLLGLLPACGHKWLADCLLVYLLEATKGEPHQQVALAHSPASHIFTWSEQMVSSLRPISSAILGFPASLGPAHYVLILTAELGTP